jgi:hypothetical protein
VLDQFGVEIHQQTKAQAGGPQVRADLRSVNALQSWHGLYFDQQKSFDNQVDLLPGNAPTLVFNLDRPFALETESAGREFEAESRLVDPFAKSRAEDPVHGVCAVHDLSDDSFL